MRLREAAGKMLIDAPSTDQRLNQLPGYGWQPTPRAWEFPAHPGIVWLAIELFEGELEVPESLQVDANAWYAKLHSRTGPPLTARIETNRYYLEHGSEDAEWADLIPSREPTYSGSRFIQHPQVLLLVEQIFGPKSAIEIGVSEQAASPTLELTEQEQLAKAGLLEGAMPTALETLPATDVSHDVEDLGKISPLLAELETSQRGDQWVDATLQVLRESALGRLTFDDDFISAAKPERNQMVLRLAVAIASQRSEGERSELCGSLIGVMDWSERDHLFVSLYVSPLEYVGLDAIDDATLLRTNAICRIGSDRFPSLQMVRATLLNFASPDAYRRVVLAYQEGTLIADMTSLRLEDVGELLKEIVSWLADRLDEDALNTAFDTYIRFLTLTETPAQLSEVVRLCESVGNRRTLRVRATLLASHALHASVGIETAISYLATVYQSLPSDYDDRDLISEEAQILAGHDERLLELVASCMDEQAKPHESTIQVRGRLLVVGGHPRFKQRGLEAIQNTYPGIDCQWLDVNEAARGDRLRSLILQGGRSVLLYTWVLSHSAETRARAAAVSAGRRWHRVRMPALAAMLRDIQSVVD